MAEIYWVIGSGTNVGKTTIATALLRVLNTKGCRAVGFKPVGGVYIYESIDFIIDNFRNTDTKIYGNDTIKLAKSSKLNDERLIDIVSPVYYLMYPRYPSFVMMRAGSKILKNVEYFKTPLMDSLKERDDFKHILKETDLPVEDARPVENKLFPRYGDLLTEKIVSAYEYLAGMGIDALVIEGAANFLPVWKDNPTTNHIFSIGYGLVTFFPNINKKFAFGKKRIFSRKSSEERRPDYRDFQRSIDQQPLIRFEEPLYVARRAELDQVAVNIVENLLKHA